MQILGNIAASIVRSTTSDATLPFLFEVGCFTQAFTYSRFKNQTSILLLDILGCFFK